MFALIQPLRPASHDDVQCEATLRNGKQCHFAAEEGTLHCRRHRPINGQRRLDYITAMEMPSVPPNQLFDLKAEIDLVKRLIAARARLIRDENTLVLYSGALADLVTRTQKLIDGAVKLEVDKGELLPKAKAMELISTVMSVIADVVKDTTIIDEIHERLTELLEPEL
jgi:hypothetical protein